MTDQLVLTDILMDLDNAADIGPTWQLDPATCEIGRRGVARARQVLQAARTAAEPGTVAADDLPAAA